MHVCLSICFALGISSLLIGDLIDTSLISNNIYFFIHDCKERILCVKLHGTVSERYIRFSKEQEEHPWLH